MKMMKVKMIKRRELEVRIWGKSIASAREKGIISEKEARFLLDEYFREFATKSGGDAKSPYPAVRRVW